MQVTQSQIQFLTNKPWWTSSHHTINDFLQKVYPAELTHLAANPDDKPEVDALMGLITNKQQVQIIRSTDTNTISRPMISSACHDNSAALVKSGKADCMITGFALSPDGLWRHHSWCMDADGIVIETTKSRLVYVCCTT